MTTPHTYYWFEGIALAPDGRELIVDYADPDEGGTKLCFRYVISLQSPPRLITGYVHESGRSESEIGYDQIPQDVFRDALDWLRSNAATERANNKEALTRILTEHLESLNHHGSVSSKTS